MRERFDGLLRQAEAAFATGELRRSIALFSEAEQLAAESRCQDLADRAFCNRCAVLIELDEATQQIPKLKQILLRSRDARNRWLAAYYSAMAYDLDDDLERASSYARRARELAVGLDDQAIDARCANLTGTLALRCSSFDEAESAYLDALAAHEGLDGYHRITEAQVRDNLGYVYMCTDRLDDGVRQCEDARTALEALAAEHCLHQTLQDLCYGYLLQERLTAAQACGEIALRQATKIDDALVAKNCLFLLSEIAVRRGDAFAARRYLRELSAHYPETAVSEEMIDVFLTTDLTSVVNLRG